MHSWNHYAEHHREKDTWQSDQVRPNLHSYGYYFAPRFKFAENDTVAKFHKKVSHAITNTYTFQHRWQTSSGRALYKCDYYYKRSIRVCSLQKWLQFSFQFGFCKNLGFWFGFFMVCCLMCMHSTECFPVYCFTTVFYVSVSCFVCLSFMRHCSRDCGPD